jgi:hypothetical protein
LYDIEIFGEIGLKGNENRNKERRCGAKQRSAKNVLLTIGHLLAKLQFPCHHCGGHRNFFSVSLKFDSIFIIL